jgi:hypothetical protein
MSIEMRTDSRHQESKVRLAGTELWLLGIAEVRQSVALSPLSLSPLSRLLFASRLSTLRLSGFSRRARQDLWFRHTEMPPGNKRSKQKNTNKIRHLINNLMESRLRILKWLSLLLLSAGLVGWSHRVADKTEWRPYLPNNHPKAFSLKNLKQILQTYQRTMEIQLKTLRWLSLLLLSEGLRWEPHNLAHISWFRRA